MSIIIELILPQGTYDILHPEKFPVLSAVFGSVQWCLTCVYAKIASWFCHYVMKHMQAHIFLIKTKHLACHSTQDIHNRFYYG